MRSIKVNLLAAAIVCFAAIGIFADPASAQTLGSDPVFTTDIASTPDGDLVLANKGNSSVEMWSPDFKNKKSSWKFDDYPTGVTVGNGKIYATTFTDIRGQLHIIDIASGKLEKSIEAGSGANAPVLSKDGKKIYVLNFYAGDIYEIELPAGVVKRKVKVLREPKGAVISPDGKYLYSTNFQPQQRADIDYVAADVSVIDLDSFMKVKDLKLGNGSNALRGISLSEDGDYVFVSHNLGRFQVPTSQLQQGWMNTSAMSIIDVKTNEYVGTVLLDEPERGAAGIWDIKTAAGKIVITHSGTHDVSVVDYAAMIDRLKNYKGDNETLAIELQFLYGIRDRIVLKGNGPRKMAVVGDKVYIPTYFSDTLNVLSLADNSVGIVPLVANRKETIAQKGERYFNDATFCFQNWQSCNGCHPGDARADGMNWDLMNDAIGNPKNCKSLLYSHVTPPSMISGIRESAELAVRRGFQHIQFYDAPEEVYTAVDEYCKALEAVPSPYLVNGELSDKAKKGRKVFEKFSCDRCHSGPYYTDMKMHRIGEDVEFEKGWDTPTLREVWRTAPYLFDGRAATMREVFEVHKHGIESNITATELDQLVEYVNSL